MHRQTQRLDRQTEIGEWLNRVRGEYLEMPGLALTKPQMGRLWNLDTVTCEAVLDVLVGQGFLIATGRGAYVIRAGRPV